MYPMLLSSPYKKDVWGGNKIYTMYNNEEYRSASQLWLLSATDEGESTVKNGSFKDKTVSQVFEELGRTFGGKSYDTQRPFPLFIRLIDAKDNLPLQVCTKERMLIVLAAEDNANMIYGFTHDISDDEIHRRLSSNTLFPACNLLPVNTGDIIKIPAGLLCAVGKGILCCEIGSGDSETYTVSDYGRTDINGNRAELDIKGALEHINLSAAGNIVRPEDTFLYPFGTVSEVGLADGLLASFIRLGGNMGVYEDESFVSLIITEGSVMLSYPSGTMHLKAGDSVLVPAKMRIKLSGYANLICAHLR